MVTKTKPIKARRGPVFPPVELDDATRRSFVEILGIAEGDAAEVFREIESALSEGLGRMRWEQVRALPPHFDAELKSLISPLEKAITAFEALSGDVWALLGGSCLVNPVTGATIGTVREPKKDALVEVVMAQGRAMIDATGAQVQEGQTAKVEARKVAWVTESGLIVDRTPRQIDKFLDAAHALATRVREVRADIAADAVAERKRLDLTEKASVYDNAYRRRNIYREKTREDRLTIDDATLRELAMEGIRVQSFMQTALVKIYKRTAVKSKKAGQAKFLRMAHSVLNAGMKRPRH